MHPIIIPFTPCNLGRVEFYAGVITRDKKSFGSIGFKLDSGSDFTTLSCEDLEVLGYDEQFLKACPHHGVKASTASQDLILPLQYISSISIKFGNRELQGCRVYFALNTKLRSLFGSDILKYFNREINYDFGELRLTKLQKTPLLASNESAIHVYSVESKDDSLLLF